MAKNANTRSNVEGSIAAVMLGVGVLLLGNRAVASGGVQLEQVQRCQQSSLLGRSCCYDCSVWWLQLLCWLRTASVTQATVCVILFAGELSRYGSLRPTWFAG